MGWNRGTTGTTGRTGQEAQQAQKEGHTKHIRHNQHTTHTAVREESEGTDEINVGGKTWWKERENEGKQQKEKNVWERKPGR